MSARTNDKAFPKGMDLSGPEGELASLLHSLEEAAGTLGGAMLPLLADMRSLSAAFAESGMPDTLRGEGKKIGTLLGEALPAFDGTVSALGAMSMAFSGRGDPGGSGAMSMFGDMVAALGAVSAAADSDGETLRRLAASAPDGKDGSGPIPVWAGVLRNILGQSRDGGPGRVSVLSAAIRAINGSLGPDPGLPGGTAGREPGSADGDELFSPTLFHVPGPGGSPHSLAEVAQALRAPGRIPLVAPAGGAGSAEAGSRGCDVDLRATTFNTALHQRDRYVISHEVREAMRRESGGMVSALNTGVRR